MRRIKWILSMRLSVHSEKNLTQTDIKKHVKWLCLYRTHQHMSIWAPCVIWTCVGMFDKDKVSWHAFLCCFEKQFTPNYWFHIPDIGKTYWYCFAKIYIYPFETRDQTTFWKFNWLLFLVVIMIVDNCSTIKNYIW